MDDAQVHRKLEKDGEPSLFSSHKSIADILAQHAPKEPKATKRTERGDLITYFHQRLTDKKGKRFNIGFIATKLAHLKLHDLYYLKSTCEDAERRGKPFGAIFWWSIKPK